MSRTIRFHKFGPAEVLKCEEHAAAQPGPGEVQVRVEAIGISWYDTLWRQNLASSQARLPVRSWSRDGRCDHRCRRRCR